jgi:hypothetical protein
LYQASLLFPVWILDIGWKTRLWSWLTLWYTNLRNCGCRFPRVSNFFVNKAHPKQACPQPR